MTSAPEPPSPVTIKPAPTLSKTATAELAPTKKGASWVGPFIFLLILLMGAVVVFSTTDFKGAKEVRTFFAPVVHLVRKEVAQQLPTLREKTQQVMDNAADLLAGETPACPSGTRPGPSVPAHAPEAHRGVGEHGPNERVCIDEQLVSQMDHSRCAVCEQPAGPRAKKKTRRPAEFCLDGKAPTTEPMRCATWKQANIYCAALAARLPTQAELRALPPTLTREPTEWTSDTPETEREKRGPFRCAHYQ
jgi:hypothetical protein